MIGNDLNVQVVGDLLALSWRPFFPVGWIFVASLLAAAMALFSYWRVSHTNTGQRAVQLLLRLALVTILAVVLLGPSHDVEQGDINAKHTVTVMVDVSESMLTEELDGRTRLQRLQNQWLSSAFVSQLENDYQVSVSTFAERWRRNSSRTSLKLEPAVGETTRLVASTVEALQSLPGGKSNNRILLLSDGIDSEDGNPGLIAAYATAKGIPIDTVIFGSQVNTQDAAVVAVPMQDFLYPNELGSILVSIYHVGCVGKTSVLRVQYGDNEVQLPVQFDRNDTVEIEIPVQHESLGQYQYQILLDQVDQESELRNNLQNVFVMVQPHRMQVLIIEGQPFWDTKFIAQTLRKDERIELTQITQVNTEKRQTIVTRKDSVTSISVPETVEDWAKYDVVIFGRSIENVVSSEAAHNLITHMQATGGNVVYARGRPYSPTTDNGKELAEIFSDIEPVRWSEEQLPAGKLQVTFAGRTTQWFSPTVLGLDVADALSRLPGLDGSFVIDSIKPNARVVANLVPSPLGDVDNGDIENPPDKSPETDDADFPAIVTGSTGSASIVVIAGDGIWRWSLLSPENADLIGFYDAFWTNLIRYLVAGGEFEPGQQVSLAMSHSVVRTGDDLHVDVVMKHESPLGIDPTLELTLPNGQQRSVPLIPSQGRDPRFQATIKIVDDGVHELAVHSPGMTPEHLATKFNAYSLNIERLNTIAQPFTLKVIADQSGGRHYNADEYATFLDEVSIARQATSSPPTTEYIWDQAFLMVLVCLIAGIEWIYRRMTELI